MITSAEAQLGKNMAILAAITTVVSFIIGAVLIGPWILRISSSMGPYQQYSRIFPRDWSRFYNRSVYEAFWR